MGRSKSTRSLTKAERKRVKEGLTSFHSDPSQADDRAINSYGVYSREYVDVAPQRQSQTSDNSWVHAVGFVILAAIVISWALGY